MPTVEFLPAEVDLEYIQGDDVAFEFTITGLNLEGGTGLCQVRAGESRDSTLLGTFTVTLNDNGADTDVTIELASTDNTYVGGAYWDLQITFSGSVRTYIGGCVEVSPDVSYIAP